MFSRFFRQVWRDIRHGRCSGYALCCVLFYSFFWYPTIRVEKNKVVSWPHKIYNVLKEQRRGDRKRLGYVPCPFHVLFWGQPISKRCQPGCSCGLGDEIARCRGRR